MSTTKRFWLWRWLFPEKPEVLAVEDETPPLAIADSMPLADSPLETHATGPTPPESEPPAEATATVASANQVVVATASLPATVPISSPPAALTEEHMRMRAMYFAPAAYSRSASPDRILAPDLLFRLGGESRRAVEMARTPLVAPPPAVAALSAREAQPRLMDQFSTAAATEPIADSAGCVHSVDPLLFTLFISAREGAPEVPPEATSEYLAKDEILTLGLELRDRVIRHWRKGGAPLRPPQLYDLARDVVPHPGTALLLCHNTAKAFARGGGALRWGLTRRKRGEYSDGTSVHLAAALHRDGVLIPGPFANPSIFFVLFSATEFGLSDPGGYYRYFAAAAAAWYAGGGRTRIPVFPPSSEARQVAETVAGISRSLIDPKLDLTPGYRAWLWMNAVSFLEGATYCRTPGDARAIAQLALRGVGFGLREAEQPVHSAWRWQVPSPRGGSGAVAEFLTEQPECT